MDVIEAGFADANFNGIVDGAFGANGWATAVSSLPACVFDRVAYAILLNTTDPVVVGDAVRKP